MFRLISSVFCLAVIVTTITAQRTKLYKEFDPLDTSDRFNLLTKQGGISYRLPNDTIPIRYDIQLTTRVDEGNFDFTGNVKINLRIVTQTNTITIHSKQLTILNTQLRNSVGGVIETQLATLDPVTEFLTVQTVVGQLTAGQEYVLEINYNGILRQDDQGFYRSSYVNGQGQTV
jgi:aminopeptidase N